MSGVCEYCNVRYAGEVCSSCSYRPEVMAARAAAKAAATADAAAATVQFPPVNGLPQRSVPLPRGAQPIPAGPSSPQVQTAPFGQQVPAPRPAPQAAPAYGASKFVGDAQPFGGMPLSRILNALSYVVAGIAMLVISAQQGVPVVTPLLGGLAFIGYGIKIAVTRGSYWVSSLVYVLAGGAVLVMFGVLSR